MSVDIIPRKYNEEEQEFIRKYGESSFLIWETLSDSQKSDYYELEQLYSDFFELYRDHYDDLKLYALMYRNVPLYNITNDVFSVSFFCTHKKEIIGFTKRVATEKSLENERVNLSRVNDILKELEKQVGPLKEQSETARKYLAFKEELKKLDINAFLLDVDERIDFHKL